MSSTNEHTGVCRGNTPARRFFSFSFSEVCTGPRVDARCIHRAADPRHTADVAGVLMHLLQRQAHNRALHRAKTCPEEELFAESRCDESKDIARIQEVFWPEIWIVPIRPNHIINKQMMDPEGQNIFIFCSRPRQCLSCIHLFTLSYTHTHIRTYAHTHMRSHRAGGQMDRRSGACRRIHKRTLSCIF